MATSMNEKGSDTVSIFSPILTQILSSAEIASSKVKKVLNDESVKEVKISKDGETEKVKKLLDLFVQSQDEGKWNILNEVLENIGFIFLPKVLEKEHSLTVQEQMKNIVNCLYKVDIKTQPLSQIAKNHGLLTESDLQDIGTECLNQEEKAALIVLIDRIVTPPPDEWYDEFLTCLCEAGHQEAVKRMKQDSIPQDDCGAVEATKPDDYSTDVHWRKLIMELFYNNLITSVKASEILINLSSVFNLDEKRSIRQTERNKTSEEAMQLLLDKFDKKESPGKWKELRTALVEADYEWIIRAIEGDDVNFTERTTWQNMINLFTKELASKIIPSQILHDLCTEKIISKEESEEIKKEEQNKGDISAAFLLLTSIPRMHPEWYPKFMEILFLNGWDETVACVDSDEWKRLNHKHEQKMSDNAKYYANQSLCINMEKGNLKKTLPSKFQQSDIQENYASYTEKPRISNNNLSSNDRLEQDDGHYIHRSTMMELSIDDNNPLNDEHDEITREKQLASTSQIQLPVPVRRGQIGQNLPSVPETSVNEPQSTDEEYVQPDSIMLQDVKRNLEMEVNGEPEQNIPVNVFEDMKIDSDSEDDGPSQPPELLTLRSYQKELAAPGLQGKNCIIVAPTGSGKTHVALKIMLEHMNQVRARRHPKVIFLVEQGALAQQQAKMCIKYLPCKVKLITGETQRNERQKSFSEWLAKRDILVVTAQLLVNALIEQDVTIDDFTLMVFDECHHAHANHSYNRIMQAYMDQKIKNEAERNKLPMIVGLTASVGVGRAKTTEGAIDWIKTMMANMDAEELATVRVNIDELSEYVIVPEQVIKRTARRTKNYFGEAVGKIMEVTERYMKQSAYADGLGADKDKILKAPPVKGSDQYTQWISNLWRQTAKVFNQEARRFFTTCRTYLDLYNRALIIYEDARVKDALDFLEDNVRKVNENIIADETDNKMNTLYKKSKVLMDHCVNDVNHQNPKLDTLRILIAKTYKENMDSRGIVFVKTRDLVIAIQNWMKETDGLKALNPVKFVGAQASGEKGGMTKNDQDNILQYFKEGKHKLIIATSVAEEGLDIQKCNLVIRYDHVTNEIAMVQARGRGRAEGSKYYVIASEEKMTAEKEELNMMREARMNQAIIHLQDFIRDHRQTFIQEINDLQLEANIQQELENTNKGGRIIGDFEFEMRCGKCNEFICMSKDIKKIQAAHHAVIGEEIANHINTIRMPKPTFEDDNIKMGCGKVNCKKCGKNLGNIVIYRKAQFPVLKIENFLVSDSHGNTDVYKKWKNSPFVPLELSSQNLLDRARGVQYIFES
ncbi:antiviral innate immune response receptor RIG-I-like isoform X1 [Mytilus trossulus]|uniref:antiviral innate immune response receptor RIG-I-like isoform X1 n=2 Tax=Mytilus trossulus TaxID=6551 RepID=UPI0030067533